MALIPIPYIDYTDYTSYYNTSPTHKRVVELYIYI